MQIISKENAYNGHFKINKYTIEHDGNTHIEECFERGHSVAAIVYDTLMNKFILTKQFRIGPQKEMIEIVAGSMDKENETPTEALKREIEEELGYGNIDDDLILHITSVYVSPGGTSEKVHLYFVPVSEKISKGGGVESENISIVEMTPKELEEFLLMTNDAKTFIGINYVLQRIKEHEAETEL